MIAALPVVAQEDFFSEIETSNDVSEVTTDKIYQGFLQQKMKYGFQIPDSMFAFDRDDEGIARLQTDLFAEISDEVNTSLKYQLGFKGELEYVEWRNGNQHWHLNNEEWLLKNALLDLLFANDHWMRIGHQVFAWGESEGLAITDVLATTDLREFGQAELREIREPVPAWLYSLPFLGGKISLVNTWRAGHHRYADEDEEFYPYIALQTAGLTTKEKDPEREWELAIKYDRYLNGGDISVVAAEINDNSFVLVAEPSRDNVIYLEQPRIQVLAASANKAVDSWLLKGEIGYRRNQAVNTNIGGILYEDQWRAMLGFEFSGINDWIFSYEFNTIKGRNPSTVNDRDDADGYGQVLHVQQSALNQRLSQHLWFLDFVNDDGSIVRWDFKYDWSDTWNLAAAVVVYRNSREKSALYPFRNNDTVNLSVTYHF